MHQFSPKEQEKIARALYLDLSQQDYHRPFKEIRDIYGLSSSSVNRLFVEYSARVLAEYVQRELGKHTYVALLIDGKYMRGRQVIFCMGITAEGKKQILVRQANWRNIAGGSPANESPNQAHFPRAVHGCSRGQT